MSQPNLLEGSKAFIEYLEEWMAALPVLPLEEASPQPHNAVIVSVDVIKGFCSTGVLASPRVGRIVDPIVRLFTRSWKRGIRHFLLIQDTHEPDAVEFSAFPPHCVRGSKEAETVEEFRSLPFFNNMVVMEKNSISSGLNTGLNEWLAAHPEAATFIVVGDCTDLCTYQLAMHLRLDANARQIERRVIVPADCVETYDRPVEAARF
ncbi:MAG: isochorismatase family cysteine hydrolase, partial [Anaerolineaceae bacterium]|nr:isochorismatase family cysteine hydrolase [Anaerolineaceae bacterium]